MTTDLDWLTSTYDNHTHAFPCDQVADKARRFLAAVCDHSVPVQRVDHTPAELCPACIRVLGMQVPDPPLWGVTD